MTDMLIFLAQANPPAPPGNPEMVFRIANYLALTGWILLAFFPIWRATGWIVHAGLLPAMLACVYIGIVGPLVLQGELRFSDFGTLSGVMGLFTKEWAVVAGWVHYLVFDLSIGAWEVRDANRVFTWPMSQLLVFPCLALTLMFGPAGLLSYFIVRWTAGKTFLVE